MANRTLDRLGKHKLFHFYLFVLNKKIMADKKLPFSQIETLIPSTTAVFKVGNFVIIIYPSVESGQDGIFNRRTNKKNKIDLRRLAVMFP